MPSLASFSQSVTSIRAGIWAVGLRVCWLRILKNIVGGAAEHAELVKLSFSADAVSKPTTSSL